MSQQVIRILKGLLSACALALLAACATDKTVEKEEPLLAWPTPDDPRLIWEQSIRTSGDIIEETAADRLRRFATGEELSGTPLIKPWGVAARGGRVYVSDTVDRRVHVYDLVQKTFSTIGGEGAGALAKPLGLALDGQGRLYVTDNSGRRIVVYGPDGKYLQSVGNPDILQRPSGVAVSEDGSRIFVVDTAGVDSDEHKVAVFDGSGEFLYSIGTRGSDEGQFNLPVAIAYNPRNGDIYVVDGGNFRVQVFNTDGTFVRSFGDVGRRSGQFARPKAIAADPDGNVYVTDSAFANFQIFDAEGRLLLDVGARGSRGTGGQFMLPAGVAVDLLDGRVYVVDQFFRKIDVFRPPGTPPREPAKTS